MGATQSKKRRKDKAKKKRVSLDMPRSSSMGTLRSSDGTTTGSTACPLCPHCRSSISWSSDHSLIHSLCLYHARQGREEAWDSDNGGRGRGEEACDRAALESSCLDCSHSHPPLNAGCSRLCEISNQDYDEMSTMSLNRRLTSGNRLAAKPAVGIVQSRSADFPDLVHRKQHHYSQTKENVNPDNLCYSHFNNQPLSLRKNSSTTKTTASESRHHNSMTSFADVDNPHPPSSDLSSSAQRQNITVVVSSSSSSHVPSSSLPTTTSSSAAAAMSSSGDISHGSDGSRATKSNMSLLEDEESMLSRWLKRKQMAQELRNLRMHLQNEEVVKQSTISQTSSVTYNPLTDNNNTDSKTVRETYTSTTRTYTNFPLNTTDVGSGGDSSSNATKTDQNTDNVPPHTIKTNNDSEPSSSTTTTTTTTSPTRRSLRSKFSRLGNYRYLDNHPVMTRLQNEQNNRLELMERRMEEIRISAMQEAERRKFAEIFPAKNHDTETQKLLREARESLERMKEEKRKKVLKGQGLQRQHYYQNETRSGSCPPSGPREDGTNNSITRRVDADSRSREDSGEIIPVRVLSSSREVTPVDNNSCSGRRQNKIVSGPDKGNQNNLPFWLKNDWPDINLNHPLTWLWLPFMLFPLVLRMLLSTVINSLSSPTTARNDNSANPVATTGCNNGLDRGRNLSKQKRKRSC